jgi:hypothetical protein
MARFIPVRSQCQFDMPGERGFAVEVVPVGRPFATEPLSGRDAGEDGAPSSSPKAPAAAAPLRTDSLRRPLAGMRPARHKHPRRTG